MLPASKAVKSHAGTRTTWKNPSARGKAWRRPNAPKPS